MHMARVTGGCGCETALSSADLMQVPQALDRAVSLVTPIKDIDTVWVTDAMGRTAARTVTASRAMPFFDNAAMDGFALRLADLEGRCCLPVAGTVAAGDPHRSLPAGTALRIFTGAPLPRGADTVIMIEACIDKSHKVHIENAPRLGDNIRTMGSDQSANAVLVAAGTRIAAHHVGLLAANGISQIDTVRRPHVGVFSTGDEICQDDCAPHQIHDANRPMLIALAQQAGAKVTDLGILPDDPGKTAAALRGMADRFDLIVSSGAVSLGGKDHIRDAVVAAGGNVRGWRVALKPGKPVMFGTLGQTALTGLPGNPFAVHVGFHMFVLPQISRLLGAPAPSFAPVPAIADFDWTRKPGRAEVFGVRHTGYDTTGLPRLQRLGQSVSATLYPLAAADGLAIVPANTSHIATGARLSWRPFCQTGAI